MEEMVAKSIPCLVLSCLQHTDAHFYFKNELKNLRQSDMFESISDTVMHFYIAYDAEYKRIIEKLFIDPYFMKSKSRFLAKISSKCLIMCDSPTFFNFLLMCAFVGRVASFCYEIGKCYRVAENACKCAIAVFQRKFLELFNREGGLEGLWTYSNCLNETVLDKQDECNDLKDILTPDLSSKELVLNLLNDCEEADFAEYDLTRFEKKLLYNVTIKQLRKLKSGIDCLMYHIPRKYFQIMNHSRNVVFKVFNSNVVDKKLNQRAECSLICSSPIKDKMKKDSEPSISRIIEKQSELSDCSNISEHSRPSNVFIDEKEFESPNNNSSDFSSKHTIPERSLPLVYFGMSKKEQSSTSYERSNQEPESAIESSRILKLNFDEALKSESPKQEDAVRRHNFFPFETSPEREVATFPKEPEKAKSSLATADFFPKTHDNIFHSIQNQSLARFCQSESSFPTTHSEITPAIGSSDHNGKKNQISIHLVPHSRKSSLLAVHHSSEGYFASESNISDPSGNEEFESNISLLHNPVLIHLENSSTERKDSEGDTTTLKPLISHKCFHCRKQSPTKFCQCKLSFTATHSDIATANDSSDHHGRRQNQMTTFSLFSKSSSISTIQHLSDGYLASDSNISDFNENKEFQTDLFPLQISTFTNLENAPSEREYYYVDWEGDTTLKSLINHKCFHCGTKCFNYVIYAFQQFTSHFLE